MFSDRKTKVALTKLTQNLLILILTKATLHVALITFLKSKENFLIGHRFKIFSCNSTELQYSRIYRTFIEKNIYPRLLNNIYE